MTDDPREDEQPGADPAPDDQAHLPAALSLIPELDAEEARHLDHETFIVVERRVKAMELYRRRQSMTAIAKELKCSIATVSRDIAKVLDGYRRQMGQDARWHIANELQRLNYREAEIEKDLERSRGEFVETTVGRRSSAGGSGGDQTSVKKRSKYGDPRLHALLQNYWLHRCKLLGLLKGDDLTGGLPPVKLISGINPVDEV